MRHSRRDFLRHSASLALGLSASILAGCRPPSSRSLASVTGEGMPIVPGLQLYTVRDLLAQDLEGTLAQVAEIGYREVQVSSRLGHAPAALRSMLDASGLACPSMHLEFGSPIEAEIDAALALGARSVFLSAPIRLIRLVDGQPVGVRDDVTLDTWREIADQQSQAGARFREAGLVYGYHNHHFEFFPIDSVLPYDLLLERTDPELVAFEVDLGWMQVMNVDPVVYLDRYPGRFPVCHVKDVRADGTFVDLGEGIVDFQRTFDVAQRAGLVHFFVEHDTTSEPIASARAGHRYLSALRSH